MTLFSRPTDIHSHRTRLVLAEKNINIEISNIPGPDLPEDLLDLNPYHTVPTLDVRWTISGGATFLTFQTSTAFVMPGLK